MIPASFQIAYVLGIIGLMIIIMITDKIKTSLVFLIAIALLLVGGSVSLDDTLAGVSNPSIITIFALIVITAGINDNYDLALFFEKIFGKAGHQRTFIWRMGLSVSAISSVMNNTPVVAMMMPYVYKWGRDHKINPSRLLIPLSFSAIVGGVITLIGTSTNLVLNGLLEENSQPLLHFGDFVIPGILVTLGCLLFLFLFGPWLLRDKKEILKNLEENPREYLVETKISNDSEPAGKTVEQAGLRNLNGIFLTEIIRNERHITPVRPNEVLQNNDILLFAGDTGSTLELIKKVKGLELSKQSKFQIDDNAEVVEAVITQNSTLDRRTVKEIGFREKYDAAIIGIHRQGEKVSGKIGAQTMRAGDLLLLTAGPEFRDRNHRNNDLLIINTISRSEKVAPARTTIFIIASLLAIGLAVAGFINLLNAVMIILFVQVLLKLTSLETVKKNVSFDLLIILVSSLAIGKALIDSGAADFFTNEFFKNAHNWNPLMILGGVFFMTFLLTSFITNVAAVTIIFPIVFSLASQTTLPAGALYLTAAYAASCCFATPFAYQTNLMVMEAGNYSFNDFLRIGIPMSIVYALIFLTFAAFKFNLV